MMRRIFYMNEARGISMTLVCDGPHKKGRPATATFEGTNAEAVHRAAVGAGWHSTGTGWIGPCCDGGVINPIDHPHRIAEADARG